MILRPYQLEDVNFLKQYKKTANFSEQRTGKTPTSLKTMEAYGIEKILIICPKSAIFQWVEEYEQWLGKPCIGLAGSRDKKLKDIKNWESGLVISYGAFKETEKNKGLVNEILAHNPKGIILDEAHKIKNRKSAVNNALAKTTKIPFRMALTGTPAPNKAHEIWGILNWLYPKEFGSYWRFIDIYFSRRRKLAKSGTTYQDIGAFRRGMEKRLQRIMDTFSVQHKRKEVMSWLPEKDYQTIKLPATKEQEKYLKELKKYFKVEDLRVQGVLDRLMRYRQICLHPELLGLKGSSPKLEWVLDYIEENPKKPILIFSKFTSFLKILEKELKLNSYGVIIGSTPTQKRDQYKKDFQQGRINILLINIDAGKEALTLDKAETAIFTDKYPPVGDILQAEDRFIATTEEKANKPHTIVELMIKGTYDEQIYNLLKARKSETDIINNYKNYIEKEAD